MLKRWFCLALALVLAGASLSLAEEVAVPNDGVILDGAEDALVIEEMPGDFEILSLDDVELSLSEPGDGLSDDVPESAGAGSGLLDVELANEGEGEPRLVLSAQKLTIGVKEKCTVLKATRVPSDTGDAVTWSSSKTSVVKVDKKTGKLTGVKKGTATITAKTASGLKATCKVTVKKAPGKVTLTPAEVTLAVGETCGLTSKLPSGTGSTLTYTSANKGVATVDKLTGVVTAVAPGSTKITVKTFNGKKAVCAVTVAAEPSEVRLPETLTLCLNEKTTVQAVALDASGAEVPATFTYRAQNGTGRITINKKTGKVVGRAVGTATIYVTTQNGVSTHLDGGQRVETACAVNVVEGPDRIELAAGEVAIGVDQTFDLAPRVLATDGSVLEGATYTVSSSSESGLSVSDAGVVRGLAVGSYTVTVTAANGVSAKCAVTVLAAPSGVTLSPKRITLAAGFEARLTAKLPANTMASLTYTSSDAKVAAVDGEGNVTAVAPGTAVVRVETHNGKSDECAVTVTEATGGFSVSPTSVVGSPGDAGVQLTWRFADGETPSAVTFESADPSVAAVSPEGYISFVGAGTTVVTATAKEGWVATVEVTVLSDAQDPVSYRIFAAYSYYDSLPFVKRNANGMANVFKKSSIDGRAYATKVLGNPSKDKLLSGISSFFKKADDNDVSIVYLCSHGHNNKSSYSSYRLSLMGYDSNKNNPKYYLTASEIFASVKAIQGKVILILDSCYSGTFINDMKSKLNAEDGRIAVLTAASNTRATFYNNKSKAVDFFTFFLLQGLGYNERDDWWNANASGDKGSYPGYFAADLRGNGDGAATLGEFYSFASNCIDANIPKYMKKSWYWGDKEQVQKTRIYAGSLKNLVIYQPK